MLNNTVTETLIPRILTKYVTNDSMKKNLARYLKVQLPRLPINWQDTGILNSLNSPNKEYYGKGCINCA